MTVVKVLLLILKIASALMDYIERRGILKEGEIKALTQVRKELDDRLDKAGIARSSVDHSSDSVSNDPNNRDNRNS